MFGNDRRAMDEARGILAARGCRVSDEDGPRGVLFAECPGADGPVAVAVDAYDEGHPEERATEEEAERLFRELAEDGGFARGDLLLMARRRHFGPGGGPLGTELVPDYREGFFVRSRDNWG